MTHDNYNYSDLKGEIISGVLAGLAVSPLVAMVDKAVFSSASGKMSYTKSFKECGMMLLISPMVFFRRTTFKWCFAVYAATFATANYSDRLARLNDMNPRTTSFFATSAVNITLNIYKDKYLTRNFAVNTERPLTRGSLICYIIRDLITIVGAFTLVEPVAHSLQNYVGFYWLSRLIAQSICPIGAQLLNTPFFIYGMDLYHRPQASNLERLIKIKNSYWNTYYWSRVARIGPAFSVGGILNFIFRTIFTDSIVLEKENLAVDVEKHDGASNISLDNNKEK